MLPTHNKAAPLILAYIEANPQCAAPEIAARLAMPPRKVQYSLNVLLDHKLVHIAGYERPVGSGKAARLFTAGDGESMPRRRATRAQKEYVKLQWQRRKRATERVLANAGTFGVFGVAAAQVIARRAA